MDSDQSSQGIGPLRPDRIDPGSGNIGVFLSKRSNQRLLQTHLESHRVLNLENPEKLAELDLDLLIIDPPLLRAHRQRLNQWRNELMPSLVPVLLLVPERDFARAYDFRDLADEILAIPIRKVELLARIDILLKLRRMSQAQERAWLLTENTLAGVNRAFRAFSACNEAVVWAKDENTLLREVCELMVSEGGYRLAWVGYADKGPEKPVTVMAGTAESLDFCGEIQISYGENEWGQGAAGSSIRDNNTVVIADTRTDPRFSPWRKTAEDYGVASVIALPISVNGRVIGVLSIYSDKTNAFDEQEVVLLERMAVNLAYGIQSLRDSRERREQERRATFLAYSDPLTRLANRAHLSNELVDLSRKRAQGAAVIFLDLDGFKLANDALGHGTGDELLKEVASRIVSAVRETDLVARQGGDEFIVLMADQERHRNKNNERHSKERLAKAATEVAERILRSLGHPFQLGHHKHSISGSIGVSLFPVDGTDAETLLTRADQAMYLAKAAGGNTVRFFSEDLAARQEKKRNLQQRLREAVDENAFELYYQPIIDMQTSSMVSLEALIRWPQADGSFISPAEFIPIVEETGLILPLGRWIIDKAMEDLHKLQQISPKMAVAINLSVKQFHQLDLGEYIADRLSKNSLSPASVTFEVTESSMMSDSEVLEKALNELNEIGHSISLDDFGTGYSSLWRLRELPLSVLKIDRSFLSGLPADQVSMGILRAILDMARHLNMTVVGEGIETEEQWQVLRDLGCDLAQGFLMARPKEFGTIERELIVSAESTG